MEGQRSVFPAFALVLVLVAGGVWWLGVSPDGSIEGPGRGAGVRPEGGESGNVETENADTSNRAPARAPVSPTPPARPNPLSIPGSGTPLSSRNAEIAKGLTGESAQLAIRLEEALTNPDRRCVTRIRGEMIRIAKTNPSVLTDLARSAPTPRHRSWALRILGESRATDSREVAIPALQDPVDYVRANAAWVLGQVGTRDDVPLLERLIGGEETETVGRAAREAIDAILSK